MLAFWSAATDDLSRFGNKSAARRLRPAARAADRTTSVCILCIGVMQRKNITIREEQDSWIERANVNLSRFVQDRIDEAMGPTDEEIAADYRRNRERDREMYEAWEGTSREANASLGDTPSVTPDPDHPRGDQ